AEPAGRAAEPRPPAAPAVGTPWTPVGLGQPSGRGLHYPGDVVVDAEGNLFVADTWGGRVVKMAPSGRWLAEWPVAEAQTGETGHPVGLALDRRGFLFVSDSRNHAVHRLTPAGRVVASLSSDSSGSGGLRQPRGLALGPRDELLVVDSDNGRIQMLDAA